MPIQLGPVRLATQKPEFTMATKPQPIPLSSPVGHPSVIEAVLSELTPYQAHWLRSYMNALSNHTKNNAMQVQSMIRDLQELNVAIEERMVSESVGSAVKAKEQADEALTRIMKGGAA